MKKTILITGSSSGFGNDTARTLARAGHRVFASMREVNGRNSVYADALRREDIEVVELDVTDDISVERGVASVLDSAGRIDVVVNNAGVGAAGITEAFTTEQAYALFDVNVIGVHRVLRAVLPSLRKQGSGLVINIGSIYGRLTLPFFGLYSASKFAIEALTESYRYELSQLGIDVVLIQPSNFPTEVFSKALLPRDVRRRDSYGAIGEIPNQMLSGLLATFQGENAPNPHDVAKCIAGLLNQPRSSLPTRLVVGQAYGADHLNEQAAIVHTQALDTLGLSQLANRTTNEGSLRPTHQPS